MCMQKDEEKRKQQIEEWEKHREGKGYKSKYKPQVSDRIYCL